MQSKIPLIVSLVFGVIAFLGIGQYLREQSKADRQVAVLAMARARAAGDVLVADDLRVIQVTQTLYSQMSGWAMPDKRGIYIGNSISRDMEAGWPLFESNLVRPEAGADTYSFDSKLQDGDRAISIQIDDAGSLGSFLRVGDRVDILANLEVPDRTIRTISIPNQGPQTIEELTYRPTTVFLLENVRVLAVGDDYRETPGLETSRSGGRGTNLITIAVSPREAQVLSFAMRNGRGAGIGSGGSDVTFTLLLRKQSDRSTISRRTEVTYDDVLNMTALESLQEERNTLVNDGFLGGLR